MPVVHKLLAVDAALDGFIETAMQMVGGSPRSYYASGGPARVLIVMRNGGALDDLRQPNTYIKALVGWDEGTAPFVLPEDTGKVHTKITVDLVLSLDANAAGEYSRANRMEVESLAALLAKAPRADRPGGARGAVGRKLAVGDAATVPHPVTLLPAQWEIVETLGSGNRSAGVRFLVDWWKREHGG